MPDNRGRYARIASDTLFPTTSIFGQAAGFLSPTHPARQKRRLLGLLGGVVFVILTTLLLHTTLLPPSDSSRPLDRIDLRDLATPLTGQNVSQANGETTYIVGEHHAVSGNYPEDYVWLDPYSRQPFAEITYTNGMNNNAMGRMPAGSPYDMLVIGRGRNDKYMDPQEKIEYMNLTIVGFFANYNAKTGEWERVGPEPYVLNLPVWRQFPRPCQNLVNGGPADPRFLWSDAGEPLAVIGTASRVQDVCKAVGLVDLRAVWPALKQHLSEIGYGDIPIKFDTFTEVGRASSKEKYEKNWAAFFSGPTPVERQPSSWWPPLASFRRKEAPVSPWPYFASQIYPRTIVKVNPALDTSERSKDSYVLGDDLDLTLPSSDGKGVPSVANSDCIFDSLPHDWKKDKLHQATPFYRMTLCNRGTCIPSRLNTVLLGLIHYKRASKSYRRMFVTMGVDEPFPILSVSPPLHFGSAKMDDHVVFSVSMAFLPTKNTTLSQGETPFLESQDIPGGYLGHGWLDDTLVVGAGLRDEAYDAIHLPAINAVRGHTLCSSNGKRDL